MRLLRAGAVCALMAIAVGSASAQPPGSLRAFGAQVAPMFEGWYENADGTATVLVGFFNANSEETVEIPVGELNRFEPGLEDRGQPTHFPPGRSWGVLSIQVPRDFDGDLRWVLSANGQPTSMPVHLQPPYFIEPLRDAADGNEPPTIRFASAGAGVTGPPIGIAHTLSASVGTPIDLSVWTSDVKPEGGGEGGPGGFRRSALTLRWHHHSGPGAVEFGETSQRFTDTADQNPTTTAIFSAPGDYVLRAEALDETGAGGGGFQCCWTSALVQVTVSP
ncbi:MAG: hypothetical protein ABGY72_16265 [bacterium]